MNLSRLRPGISSYIFQFICPMPVRSGIAATISVRRRGYAERVTWSFPWSQITAVLRMCYYAGRYRWKTLPSPSVLSAVMKPWCITAIFLQRASPIPVPG